MIPGEKYYVSFSAKWLGELSDTPDWYGGVNLIFKANGDKFAETSALSDEEWTTLNGEVTIPDTVNEINIGMFHHKDAPACLVDDISLIRQNYVTDGDFEKGDLSLAWNSWGAIQLEQTDTFAGSYSLKMQGQKGGGFNQDVTLIPGETYNVSFTAKWLGDLSDTPNWYDGIKILYKANGDKFAETAVVDAKEWTTHQEQFTVPDTLSEVNIGMFHHKNAPTCLVDNIIISIPMKGISLSYEDLIVEGFEDGRVITVELLGDKFVDLLNLKHWSTLNFPEGVTLDSVKRVGDKKAEIKLGGNTTGDYDSDITDATIIVAPNELANLEDSLSATLTFTGRTTDLSMTDDGEIREESEDGEVITVSLENGTFADPLTLENWSATNLPEGVAIGSLNRKDGQTGEVMLSGNTTGDYDIDITNVSIRVEPAEISDFNSPLSANGGVTFIAEVEPPEVSMSDDGEIIEGNEDGEVISVIIEKEDKFVDSLSLDNWSHSNLPEGVYIGAASRANDTLVELTLFGNATVDYENDITDFTLTLPASDFKVWKESVTLSEGVTFEATSDTPTGIRNMSIKNLTVAPNPVNGVLRISADVPVAKVEIYSVIGELVDQFDHLNSSSIAIPVDDVEMGLYLLRIYDRKGNQQSEKIYVK